MVASIPTLLIEMVSEQTIPNLIPALDDRLGVSHLFLLFTDEVRRHKEAIKSIWKARRNGPYFEQLIPAFDMPAIERTISEIRGRIGHGRVILNVTCGTKIMVMAAYAVLRDVAEVVYVNTARKEILLISDPDKPSHPFRPCLGVPEYFQAYGKMIVEKKASWEAGQSLPLIPKSADVLLELGLARPEFIRGLNQAAWKTRGGGTQFPSVPAEINVYDLGLETVERINESFRDDRIAANFEDGKVVFGDRSALKYLAGEWFEWAVYMAALDAGAQEAILGLELEDNGPDTGFVQNEFDIVMIKENRLFILECKTVYWDGVNSGEKVDAIYKLDSLRRSAAGLYGRAAFVSLFPVPEFMYQRAQVLDIDVFGPEEIHDLTRRLRSWMA